MDLLIITGGHSLAFQWNKTVINIYLCPVHHLYSASFVQHLTQPNNDDFLCPFLQWFWAINSPVLKPKILQSATYQIFEMERSDWSCPNSGSIKFLYSTLTVHFFGLGAAQLRCHERNYCASFGWVGGRGGWAHRFSLDHSWALM